MLELKDALLVRSPRSCRRGAHRDRGRRLPRGFVVGALAKGRANASKLDDADRQGWAMRDAFDGVLAVVARKVAVDPH